MTQSEHEDMQKIVMASDVLVERLVSAEEEVKRLQNITTIQQKQIERLIDARDAEKLRADKLENVLKPNELECMAGGFCRGFPYREDISLSEFDIKMLTVAGKCIARIINHEEAKP